MYIFFFFFQAEDGIRDLTVTGVQTCALPIWSSRFCSPSRNATEMDGLSTSLGFPPVSTGSPFRGPNPCTWKTSVATRSEERRVGKGVDLGGGRIVEKKKRIELKREKKGGD